jgi:hypothetical protein
MGQPAFKIEPELEEPHSAAVIPLKPVLGLTPARPNPIGPATPAELPALLNMITRVATMLGAHKERADTMEKRAVAAEDMLKAANRRIAEVEIKLRSALDEARLERERAAEVQKRSNDVVAKTRAMLNEAGERLRAAECRADRAESSFNALGTALEQGFSAHVQ